MRSPLVWFGGKGRLAPKILPWFPPHHTYVEPFGGGASLLFTKKPSPVEVYNDLNEAVTDFFKVLREEELAKQLYQKLLLTPYSKVEYKRCLKSWFEDYLDPVERARRWYMVARSSFNGEMANHMSLAIAETSQMKAKHVASWQSAIDRLAESHKRILDVQIEQASFEKILNRYDTPNTLFYLDPPYVTSTRKGGGYFHEMTLSQHETLVKMLLNIEGKAILSAYKHFVYEDLLDKGWLAVIFKVTCDAVGRTKASGLRGKPLPKEHQREEMLYISPSCFSRRVRKVSTSRKLRRVSRFA